MFAARVEYDTFGGAGGQPICIWRAPNMAGDLTWIDRRFLLPGLRRFLREDRCSRGWEPRPPLSRRGRRRPGWRSGSRIVPGMILVRVRSYGPIRALSICTGTI